MSNGHYSPRMSQEAEQTKEKWKRKAWITFLVPSVKFRHSMLAFQFFEYLIHFSAIQHVIILSQSLEPGLSDGLVLMKIDPVPTEIFSLQSRHLFCQSLWSLHHFWLVIPLLLQTMITPYFKVSLSPSSQMLSGTSLPAPPISFVLGRHILLLENVMGMGTHCGL